MAIDQFQRHLIRMNDLYQSACRAFADGEISAEETRRRVHQLSFTDHEGRTWRVDTTRSGHVATFTDGTTIATLDHAQPDPQVDEAAANEVVQDAEDYSFANVRRRLTPMLAALAITVALAGIPIAYVVTRENSASSASDETAPTFAPTFSTIPIPASAPTEPAPTAPSTTGAQNSPPSTAPVTPAITTEGKTIDEIPFNIEVVFGESVAGRPLVLVRRGEPGGARVLVVGVTHGSEQAGLQMVDLLRSMDIPDGIDLWLVPAINPDGAAANVRQNANGVDLNRNFPYKWEPLGKLGYWQYAGESAGSEPETKATMALAELIVPDFVIWYHQDYFRISPSTGRNGEIRARYAGLVDLPLLPITGGTYTGTAGGWVGTVLAPNGMSLLIELGAALRPGEAQAHASAVLTVVTEFWPR